MAEDTGHYVLEVPLDASHIKNFTPERTVKVVAYARDGAVASSGVATFQPNGHGHAELRFDRKPAGLRVAIGPETASYADLAHLQTLTFTVLPSQWRDGDRLRAPAVMISPFYWEWWLVWCRDYTITGRLLCADGSPVPGATVCAFDVDWWWWWSSEEQVGCAVTDANGAFQMTFRRCCGWFWWWWWEQRNWRVDPVLADHIVPLLQKSAGIRNVPPPGPTPDLKVFGSLLSQTSGQSHIPGLAAAQVRRGGARPSFNPADLETLRSDLLTVLPASDELGRLRLWPWWPWWPWLDCDADIVFRATQNCNGQNTVVLDESVLQARWDIPSQLNVTLVANDQACCLAQPCQDGDCPAGNCIVPIDICYLTAASVGGNPGASSAPATIGYANPGGASPGAPFGDQPFSESVLLSANVGDAFDADYYEFEWTTTPAVPSSWSPMPAGADGAFYRAFWDATLTSHSVLFAAQPVGSPSGIRNVFESRQHYAANNSIGIGWDNSNLNTLMSWQTTVFANGVYYLRLKGWTRPGYGGDLADPRVIPFCDTEEDNFAVVALDNRPPPGPGAGHPTDHPCGGGTVHLCTTQPDCNIFSVTIGGQSVGYCANVTGVLDSDPVEISFMAHDPDAVLAYFALDCTYGLNSVVDIICSNNGVPTPGAGVVTGSLSAGPAASNATSWIGPAAQIGPDYGTALTQGAAPPQWTGGTFTLTTTVGALFPEVSCAYQLQLWTYKRNIVDCGGATYYNLTELSFTVTKA